MYTVTVDFKDYKERARSMPVTFNLDAREVFRMLPELKSTFEWLESNKNNEPRDLSVEEVSAFYTNFEAILLEAWGEMSEDGLHFRKGGKYEFEESATFNACMVKFVTQPQETAKLLEGILPPEMFTMVQNANDEQIKAAAASAETEKDRVIARLMAEKEERERQDSQQADPQG